MAGAIPKPNLRGFASEYRKKIVIGAMASFLVSGALFKLLVSDPRRRKYAEYYKNYDAEAKFKSISESGYLQSCDGYKMSNGQ